MAMHLLFECQDAGLQIGFKPNGGYLVLILVDLNRGLRGSTLLTWPYIQG